MIITKNYGSFRSKEKEFPDIFHRVTYFFTYMSRPFLKTDSISYRKLLK